MKLSSFIFKRMNVRDSGGDIAFYRVWVDRWEEERNPVERGKLIFHLAANYSKELEDRLLGNRRGLIDVPIDVIFLRSIVEVINGTKFILNLTMPRGKLGEKHLSLMSSYLERYTDQGFLFSADHRLLEKYPEFLRPAERYLTYLYTEDVPVERRDRLIIVCGKNVLATDYDFICEGDYEDVMVVNALKHTQAAVSKLLSMLSEERSLDEVADTIRGDPALVTKLLQYVNSPIFPHRKEIESVSMAVSYLGLENLKRFLMAVWMSQFFGQDPSFLEFIKSMLFNAFFVESFSKYLSVPKDRLFLAGLFYKMPEAFGVRPRVFFQSINLPEEILSLFEDPKLKDYLRIIDLLDREDLGKHLSSLGLSEEVLKEHLRYAKESLSSFVS